MRFQRAAILLVASLSFLSTTVFAEDRVTILYDAFSDSKLITEDWGFSALVEHGGKRILFDTGNNAGIFEHNAKALGVDLTKLDFVVISHRHTDHTTGLNYLLRINPHVTVYAPADGANGFGGSAIPASFFRSDPSLPAKMRYFGGTPPKHLTSGKAYEAADIRIVDKTTEVAPGIFLIFTVSKIPKTLEMPELTLALKSPKGLIFVDGCSHSGVEEILAAATPIDTQFFILFGGLHLVTTPEEEIDAIVEHLKNRWKLQRIAPGHCSGEPAFARLQKAFGENYFYAGAGTQIAIP